MKSDQLKKRYYCRIDRHPSPEIIRLERDEKLWRNAIECPHICCGFCSKRFSCEFVCWIARNWKKDHPSNKCKYQCSLEEKVYGQIFEVKLNG